MDRLTLPLCYDLVIADLRNRLQLIDRSIVALQRLAILREARQKSDAANIEFQSKGEA